MPSGLGFRPKLLVRNEEQENNKGSIRESTIIFFIFGPAAGRRA